jgi:hypothetical protein
MNKRVVAFAFILLIGGVGPVTAQKIETQANVSATITRVETALNHLTVIQLAEPVLSVAAGSEAFKVEWRENKVFIEPTQPNVSTNLFIWTKSGRLNYELEPAGTVAGMDFAIDQAPADAPAPKTKVAVIDPQSQPNGTKASLLGGKPVRLANYKLGKNRVQVVIKDLFQQADRVYIRYTVDNTTTRSYEVGKPQVFFLQEPRLPSTLTDRRVWQLSESEAARIDSQGQRPLEIVHQEVGSERVAPGQETVGVTGVRLPSGGRGPVVMRLVLSSSEQREVTATIIL